MSPQVAAAIIAASVSFLTLIGTLAAQYFGRRATSRDLEEQGKRLDRTLTEQRTRTLNERFAAAAGQLGSDKPPEVRLAGVYAMAGLADDWPENRQTCVDVLCGYLRIPYEPDPGHDAPEPQQLAFRASREVRHTVIRVITAHLQDGVAAAWQGLYFDLTGVVFDGGDFVGAQFSGGGVSFNDAVFSGGRVRFNLAEFSGGAVYFEHAEFSGGGVNFGSARFSGGSVHFHHAGFSGGTVGFDGTEFSGGTVGFGGARFSGATVGFDRAKFSGGTVDFYGAKFSSGTVDFLTAQFSGGEVDFSGADDWSSPPAFSWGRTGSPPPGVKLPQKEDQSQGMGRGPAHTG
jgi:hypothetical protein